MDVPRVLTRAARALGAHRIRTRPSPRLVRVESGGRVLAESRRAIELAERGAPPRYYLPPEDVHTDLLARSSTTSRCPFKGEATYWSAPGAPDAFWVYEAPSERAAAPVAGMLAPWPGRVEVTVDGEHVPEGRGWRRRWMAGRRAWPMRGAGSG